MTVRRPPPEVARRRQLLVGSVTVVVLLGLVAVLADALGGDVPAGTSAAADAPAGGGAAEGSSGGSEDSASGTALGRATGQALAQASAAQAGRDLQRPVPPRRGQLVNPASSGHMWSAEVPGILTFRGNPTRTYSGRGAVPERPGVRWYLPAEGGLCRQSRVGGQARTWCGSGWTGQPAVFERDGRTWVVFGAYDGNVHFLDAGTGQDLLAPFPTGDIIKGSVTVDPDGYPLVYTGSRDGYYRVLAIDRGQEAEELYRLSATAVSPTLWNDDWDGSGLVLDDLLLEGGENSQFHVVRLNRGYDDDGRVTVDPELVWNTPSWDAQVISDLDGNRDQEMSIENSVAVSGTTVYFANSGGLVSGWDLAPLLDGSGQPTRTLRFWTGDDTDASIVIDADGFLYVAVEYERGNARAAEVGQLVKLDPRRPDDPVVWSYADRDTSPAGFWATPALWDGVVVAATNAGKVVGLDQGTGEELWSFDLTGPTWQSPVVVEGTLVQGDCEGVLRGYDLSDPRRLPPQRWEVALGGCIESTPAVWEGGIYLGTRAGKFFALGDDGRLDSPTASQTGGGGE